MPCRRRLKFVRRVEHGKRIQPCEHRDGLLGAAAIRQIATFRHGQSRDKPVRDFAETRRLGRVHAKGVRRVRRRPHRIHRAARRHERTVSRRPKPLKVGALADVGRSIRILVNPVREEKAGAFPDDGISHVPKIADIAGEEILRPCSPCNRALMEDMVVPEPLRSAFVQSVLDRLPAPARTVFAPVGSVVPAPRLRRFQGGEPEFRTTPRKVEVSGTCKPLVGVHLVKAEVPALPVMREHPLYPQNFKRIQGRQNFKARQKAKTASRQHQRLQPDYL